MQIPKDKLRLALEIANPDMEVTDICVDHLHKWCEYQIEIVRDILEGRLAPTFHENQLKLYDYPKEIADSVSLRLSLISEESDVDSKIENANTM
jgi:hypothetical protein